MAGRASARRPACSSTCEDGRIAAVTSGMPAPLSGARRLDGLTLPGLANAHSHAFQRALRGRTQRGSGSFWTWREQMYARGGAARPGQLPRARARDIRRDGARRRHDRRRVPLHPPRSGRGAVRRPERDGPRADRRRRRGRRPDHADRRLLPARRHRRAARRSAAALLRRQRRGLGGAGRRRSTRASRCGWARRSTACAPWTRSRRRSWRAGRASASARCTRTSPSSPPRTTPAWRPTVARPPACWPRRARSRRASPPCTPPTSTDGDVDLLGGAGACCCVCPTTERDLADGIGAMRRLVDAGASLSLGSDSHAVIDLFEEARAVELDERLASGERGRHDAAALLRAASEGGHACLGWPDAGPDRARRASRPRDRRPGRRAAGRRPSRTSVARGGRLRRDRGGRAARARGRHARSWRDGRHVAIDVPRELRRGDPGGHGMSLVIDNIGLLVTCDPEQGEGPLGLVRDAALVIEDAQVAAIERAGAAGDERVDAAGRCVIPGFVDSHTHLVFAGDRADEFAARMAGRPYAASGIRVTTEATRAASEDELRALARARRGEAVQAGITHLEIKSGYGLEPEAERRSCAVAAELTDDVTFLGAHAVPPEYEGRRRRVRRAGVRRDARRVPALRALDRRVLRGGRVRRRPVARRARGGPRRRPRPARARQPARLRPRGAARGRARRGLGGPLHVPLGRRHRGARRRATRSRPSCPPRTSRRASPTPTRAGRSTPAWTWRSRPTATPGRATRPRWRSASRSPCATCA